MGKVRMTYGEVLALTNAGVPGLVSKGLSADDRYSVFDLKQKLKGALEEREKRERELIRECGIEDAAAFDARNAELRKKSGDGTLTEEERTELDGNTSKLESFFQQRRELDRDTVEMELRPVTHEAWFVLRDANAAVKGTDGREHDLLPDWVEPILFNKFWLAPQEESGKQPVETE